MEKIGHTASVELIGHTASKEKSFEIVDGRWADAECMSILKA